MPFEFCIRQVILNSDGRVRAKSPQLDFSIEEAIQTLAACFGTISGRSLFVQPIAHNHVAIGRFDPEHGFYFLILGQPLYDALGDPFAIAERYPPDWSASGELALLNWPADPLPQRTTAELDALLKTGDGPFWLGAAQALLDGGRIAIKHSGSTEGVIRAIWQLLPAHSRTELWPATLAANDELEFHLFALVELPTNLPEGVLTEDQTRDYPEGRYELGLQVAIEAGDQAELTRLFLRRSSRETMRLAAYLVTGAVLLAAGFKVFQYW